MVELDLKIDFNEEKRLINISGTLMAIHCHHFNTNLLQSLEDADYINGDKIIIQAAEKVAFEQLINIFQQASSLKDKLDLAMQVFKTFGFGSLDLSGLSEDGTGTCTSPISHLVKGWLSKFGKREEPLCYFTCGFIAGSLAAATGKEKGTYKVIETQCMSTGAPICKFEVKF
jgi:hypothetical protein